MDMRGRGRAKDLRSLGVFTALVTPFGEEGIHEAAIVALVERQIEAGVQGLVVAAGPAGEAATLRHGEAEFLIDLCVKAARGRAAVVVGAASNSTASAIARVRLARDLGADAALVTPPWYNRPSQEGVFRHYEAIADAVAFPVLVDDCPSRTALSLTIATLERLGRLPELAGIVDATGDVARASTIRRKCPDWTLLSGHEPSRLGYLAHGGHGCVSVTANVAPEAVCAVHRACAKQDWSAARQIHDQFAELDGLLALDPVPAAAKLALSWLGYCSSDVRLPMTACSEATMSALAQAMRECGLAWPPDAAARGGVAYEVLIS